MSLTCPYFPQGSDINDELDHEETQSLAESDDGTVSVESDSLDESASADPDKSSPDNEPPSVPKLKRTSAFFVQPLTLKSSQMIIKAVFSENLNRENILKVLKNRFSVKQNSLTSLSVAQLMEVLAKKLLNNNYCNIRQGVNTSNMRMDDITVYKEISL